jgi:hypothetical protein
MNMKCSLVSMLMLSTVALSPAMADPVSTGITVDCPGTTLSSNMLTNFGNIVAGYGVENILSQTIQVYFQSATLAWNTPASLFNYFNDSASYNSATGVVSCQYQSNIATDPMLTVSYTITNGKGGAVLAQSANSISINLPVGLKG